MVRKKTIQYGLFALAGIMSFCGNAHAPINIIWPYDTELRWFARPDCSWDFSVLGEGAANVKAYNAQGCSTDPLRLWEEQGTNGVSSLAMVRGFPETSYIGQRAALLNGVPDDGIRGHMIPSSTFNVWDAAFAARYFFSYGISVGVCVPVYSMSIGHIEWKDCTKSVTSDDLLTKHLLTDNFVLNVQGLSASFRPDSPKTILYAGSSWQKTGVGDVAVVTAFARNFPQYNRPILTNVAVSADVGLTLPTGIRADQNYLLPLPFGSDGSFGCFFGVGVELQWYRYVRGGVRADFWKEFGDKSSLRIKSDSNQADLVLLADVSAYKNWAVTRRYTIYGEIGDFARGYSLGLAYQFFNKGEDKLNLATNEFSSQIANTYMNTLGDWKLHNLIVAVSYNYGGTAYRCSPRITLYYKYPFKGERVLAARMFGMSLGLDF